MNDELLVELPALPQCRLDDVGRSTCAQWPTHASALGRFDGAPQAGSERCCFAILDAVGHKLPSLHHLG
jgi:hypothetical protein